MVLGYHSISSTTNDPFDLAVSPGQFEAHVEMLARDFEIVAADDARTAARSARVIVTFDDGYADNLEVAAPILAKAGFPATFFVNAPRSEREMWWDEIGHALAGAVEPEFLDLDVGRSVVLDVRTEPARAQAVKNLGAHLETMPSAKIEALLGDLYSQLGFEPQPCLRHRRLQDHEVVELSRLGSFEIGCHTQNHVALACIDHVEAQAEIEASRDHVTALTGAAPRSFAYPFGSFGYTLTSDHARMVEEAGFRQAFTTERQDVNRWFNPYLIPRYLVGPVDAEALRVEIAQGMGL